VTPGRPARFTDVVAGADAAALVHPSCRPLVRGLLAVLEDPATGVDPASTRHAWVALDLLGPLPLDAPLAVTASLRRTARLGSGDGLWIDVDVEGPDGTALVRSRHVVAGDTSDAHAQAAPDPIVPGLLALWSAIALTGRAPTHVEARFPAPLPVGVTATVLAAGDALAARVADATVLRAVAR
jgi:hypothetical protein